MICYAIKLIEPFFTYFNTFEEIELQSQIFEKSPFLNFFLANRQKLE